MHFHLKQKIEAGCDGGKKRKKKKKKILFKKKKARNGMNWINYTGHKLRGI